MLVIYKIWDVSRLSRMYVFIMIVRRPDWSDIFAFTGQRTTKDRKTQTTVHFFLVCHDGDNDKLDNEM